MNPYPISPQYPGSPMWGGTGGPGIIGGYGTTTILGGDITTTDITTTGSGTASGSNSIVSTDVNIYTGVDNSNHVILCGNISERLSLDELLKNNGN